MAHFDPSDDFSRLIDRLEPVQLVYLGNSEGEALLALRQPIVSHTAQDDAAELAWLLSDADLTAPLRAGDAIVDAAGVRHAILDAEREALGTRWRCTTRAVVENEPTAAVALLQAIRARWAAAPTLVALLPESRLFCDASAEGIVPAAQLTQESRKPLMRYGDGTRVDETQVRVVIGAASAGEATAIRNEAALTLDCCAFPLEGGGRVLDMQMAGESRRRERDGLFLVTLDFQCMVLVSQG